MKKRKRKKIENEREKVRMIKKERKRDSIWKE